MERLPDNWEELLMGAANEGASIVEMRAVLGIGDSAWDTLQEDYEEFRLSVQRAKQLSQVWWERKGRELTQTGSAVAWKFNMQNRFGWSERQETALTGADGGPIDVRDVTRTIIDPKN